MHEPRGSQVSPSFVAVTERYAGFWQRLFAYLLDGLLLAGVQVALNLNGVSAALRSLDTDGALSVTSVMWAEQALLALLAASYVIVLNARGATLGKQVLGIRVVDAAGQAPGLRRGVIRFVLPGLGLLVWPLFAAATVVGADWTLDEWLQAAIVAMVVMVALVAVGTVDVLSMLWDTQRQTLHDRMAGTWVVRHAAAPVPAVGSGWAASPPAPRRGLPRVAIGLLVVLAVCTIGATLALTQMVPELIETLDGNVEAAMTERLETTAASAIDAGVASRGVVRWREEALDVNTTMAVEGEFGWETGPGGTTIYGYEVLIVDGRIGVGVAGQQLLSGVPVVRDGRIVLEDVREHAFPLLNLTLLSEDGFVEVVEGGLNGALEQQRLIATDLKVVDGQLVVAVEKAMSRTS